MSAELILFEEEYERIHDAISRLKRDANALSVYMIEKSGQQIAAVGQIDDIDATALASLTAGNVAATEGLARPSAKRIQLAVPRGRAPEHPHHLVAGRVIPLVVFDDPPRSASCACGCARPTESSRRSWKW
jgi:hypothetical protein